MATKVKFLHRQKPVKAPVERGSNRIGKQHRPFGEPVAFLKSTPQFEGVPFPASGWRSCARRSKTSPRRSVPM